MSYRTDTLKLDMAKCTNCGICRDVCPHAVLGEEERRAKILNPERCMECGACMRNCAPGAIRVDIGVGCAAAIISGALKGTEPTCGCADNKSCC